MSLHTEWVKYGNNKPYLGFLARPSRAAEPLPAVIVVQEIWGIDSHIQEVTTRFAQAGYTAFAPDLYAVDGVRPSHLQNERVETTKQWMDTIPPALWGNAEAREEALSKLPQEESTPIAETMKGLLSGHDIPSYLAQLQAASAYLRETSEFAKGQKVGIVGFCMGGALAVQLACTDPKLSASIIFYGNAPQEEQIKNIQCPVIGFYGGLDSRITDNVPTLAKSMQKYGKSFDYHIYEEAPHAFFNDTRGSYRADASRDAFAKVLAFFNQRLMLTK